LLNKIAPLLVLGALASVESGYWAMVTHDAGPDFAAGTLFVSELDVGIIRHGGSLLKK
jgi:hypothetical protein